MSPSIIAGLISGIAAGLFIGLVVTGITVALATRRDEDVGNETSREARIARDMTVLAELLAERLAKIWLADTPSPLATEGDALYHHVLESTTTIVKQAGASAKAATAVGALTAKRVRPGPIRGRHNDGSEVTPTG